MRCPSIRQFGAGAETAAPDGLSVMQMQSHDTFDDAVTRRGESVLLLGRFRILSRLGDGGMGSVWLAEDMQLDGRKVALKMLPSVLASNQRACRQLKDEALVAMKLSHPNIVTLRAFEENNGNPFLVMDYVEGQTLDDYLAGRLAGRAAPDAPRRLEDRPSGQAHAGLPEDEVVRLLKPIAAALDYAHAKGVIHRDVKPSNVMVEKNGTPYILDFGIAREIQESMTLVTGHSATGTPLYMSPEQLRGASPDPLQDVYSFAAMAYECVKGVPPFRHGHIDYQILNVNPEPVDSPLATGIMKGLSKDPADRPRSCIDVLLCPGGAAQAASTLAPPARAPATFSSAIHGNTPAHDAAGATAPAQPIVISNTNTIVVATHPAGRTPRCDVLEPEKYDKPIFDDGSRAGRRLIVFLLVICGALLILYWCFFG